MNRRVNRKGEIRNFFVCFLMGLIFYIIIKFVCLFDLLLRGSIDFQWGLRVFIWLYWDVKGLRYILVFVILLLKFIWVINDVLESCNIIDLIKDEEGRKKVLFSYKDY